MLRCSCSAAEMQPRIERGAGARRSARRANAGGAWGGRARAHLDGVGVGQAAPLGVLQQEVLGVLGRAGQQQRVAARVNLVLELSDDAGDARVQRVPVRDEAPQAATELRGHLCATAAARAPSAARTQAAAQPAASLCARAGATRAGSWSVECAGERSTHIVQRTYTGSCSCSVGGGARLQNGGRATGASESLQLGLQRVHGGRGDVELPAAFVLHAAQLLQHLLRGLQRPNEISAADHSGGRRRVLQAKRHEASTQRCTAARAPQAPA